MSLVINGTAQTITVTLGAATTTNPVVATCSYADQTGSANSASPNDITLSTTSPGTLVPAPLAGVSRVVNSISIFNHDTVSSTITVARVVSSTSYTMIIVALQPGYSLHFSSVGWTALDSFGNTLTGSSLPTGVTITTPNIIGVSNGSNASAGSVGEVMTASGSSVALSNNVSANICSVTLTPGDWQVEANILITGGALTAANGGVNTTSGTSPASAMLGQYVSSTTFSAIGWAVPTQRFNISTNTTVYLVGTSAFSSGSSNGNGAILARRMR